MLEKEFKYYVDHQGELVKKYRDKYIVIIGEEVVAAYNDNLTAYLESKKKHGLGNFLIQLCQPGEENYTHSYHGAYLSI